MKHNKNDRTKAYRIKHFNTLLTLLFVIAVVTALFFYIKPEQSDKYTLEYDVVFQSVAKQISSNIIPNKNFLSEDGSDMGKIVSALNDRMVYYTLDRDKDSKTGYIEHISNDYNTVYVKVNAEALLKEGSYYVGGVPIRAGEEITLRLPDFYGTGRITSVKVIKGENG